MLENIYKLKVLCLESTALNCDTLIQQTNLYSCLKL